MTGLSFSSLSLVSSWILSARLYRGSTSRLKARLKNMTETPALRMFLFSIENMISNTVSSGPKIKEYSALKICIANSNPYSLF